MARFRFLDWCYLLHASKLSRELPMVTFKGEASRPSKAYLLGIEPKSLIPIRNMFLHGDAIEESRESHCYLKIANAFVV